MINDRKQEQTTGNNSIALQVGNDAQVSITQNFNNGNNWYVRHLLCNDWRTISNFTKGDYSEIPIENILLYPNDVSKFLGSIIAQYDDNRFSCFYGEGFSEDELKNLYGNDLSLEIRDYDYKIYKRDLSELDIANKDFISESLCKNGIEFKRLGQVEYCTSGCGHGIGFVERIYLRKINFLLLEIQNISTLPLNIKSICSFSNLNKYFSLVNFYDYKNSPILEQPFPELKIKPNQSVLIPQAILLEPIEGLDLEYETDIQYTGSESTMAIDTVTKLPENKLICEILGPHQIPQAFTYILDDEERKLGVHQINPSNMLLLQRHWFCGSCPHLFIKKGNQWKYFTETLSIAEKKDAYIYDINTPIDVLKVSEIEDEVSYVDYIKISDSQNNILFNIESFKLEKDEYRDIIIPKNVSYPIQIKIQGYYTPNGVTSNSAEANLYRKQLINQTLKKINK